MYRSITKLIELAAATVVGLALAAICGGCGAPSPETGEPPRRLTADRVEALVDQAAPTWGSAIAAVDGPAWSTKLGYHQVLRAARDEPTEAAALVAAACRIETVDRILRLEPGSDQPIGL